MKIAVLSDVHGFSLALDRVLDDVRSVPDIDALVIAGDLCEGGPDPRGVYERVHRMNAFVLRGNTDRDIALGRRTSGMARYTTRELGSDGLRWLADLPFAKRFSPPGNHDCQRDLLVVHANPYDLDRPIPPDASDAELQSLLGDTQAAVIAFGHLHIAYTRQWRDMVLLDVSAVGNSRDGDISSRWGLVTWDEPAQRWQTELRRVPYPLQETEAQIQASGMPNPDKHIRRLRKATY